MEFEWDPGKRAANLLKHGLDFRHVAEVFEGLYFSAEDLRKDYGEKRFNLIGILKGRMVVVVYTQRRNKYRIISMRKANERERKKFKNRI